MFKSGFRVYTPYCDLTQLFLTLYSPQQQSLQIASEHDHYRSLTPPRAALRPPSTTHLQLQLPPLNVRRAARAAPAPARGNPKGKSNDNTNPKGKNHDPASVYILTTHTHYPRQTLGGRRERDIKKDTPLSKSTFFYEAAELGLGLCPWAWPLDVDVGVALGLGLGIELELELELELGPNSARTLPFDFSTCSLSCL